LGKRPDSEFQGEMKSDLLGGVLLLHHSGVSYDRSGSATMLYPRYTGGMARTRKVPLTFIPYYAWANRQATSMQVWVPLFKS
jgi:uncharacterized protein